MLHVLAGKLGFDPEIRTVNTKNGERDVCNMTIYTKIGDHGKGNDIPVQVTAWGNAAKELCKYGKGDSIQFVGEAKNVPYKPKGLDEEFPTMGYDIKKIDHNKTILDDVDGILKAYITPGKGKGDGGKEQARDAHEKGAAADAKGQALRQGKEAAQIGPAPTTPAM